MTTTHTPRPCRACLISAAPALLAALENALAYIEQQGLADDTNTGRNWPIGDELRAALRAAKGEE